MVKQVFLSLMQEDLTLVNLFRGQAKSKNSDLEYDDYSIKVPHGSQSAAYITSKISAKIRATSVTIFLIGSDTSNSKWSIGRAKKVTNLATRCMACAYTAPPPVQLTASCPTSWALTTRDRRCSTRNFNAMVKTIG